MNSFAGAIIYRRILIFILFNLAMATIWYTVYFFSKDKNSFFVGFLAFLLFGLAPFLFVLIGALSD